METCPSLPSFAMTRLGIVWPAAMFKFDASGRGVPLGHTVRYVGRVASVAVTFRTTALVFLIIPPPPTSTLFPYTTLFRSGPLPDAMASIVGEPGRVSNRRA